MARLFTLMCVFALVIVNEVTGKIIVSANNPNLISSKDIKIPKDVIDDDKIKNEVTDFNNNKPNVVSDGDKKCAEIGQQVSKGRGDLH